MLLKSLLRAVLLIPMSLTSHSRVELDAFWTRVKQTVEEGDFDSYKALYHPDAVLVSEDSKKSSLISQALVGWEQGFNDTREGRQKTSVDFRIVQRLNDNETAHEMGIFRYSSLRPDGGDESIAMMHFRSLLVKKNGEWLILMEYQGAATTEEEWAAAAVQEY